MIEEPSSVFGGRFINMNDDDKISLKILDHNVETVLLEFADKNANLELEKNNYRLNTDNEISEDTKNN